MGMIIIREFMELFIELILRIVPHCGIFIDQMIGATPR